MKHVSLIVSALVAVALFGVEATAQTQRNGAAAGREVVVESGKYTDVTVPEFRALAENTDFLVVNVHVPFEGDLPGTEASVPFNEITAHIQHLTADKNAKILLYCRSGRMSETAATELAKLGYTGVHNLVGGFNAWKAAGLPMAQP